MKLRTPLLILLAALGAGAQDPPPLEPRSQWTVRYLDEELGTVSGTAFVDEKGTGVAIDFEHPETGFRYPVTGVVTKDGTKIRVVVTGAHPSASPGVLPDFTSLPRIVVEQAQTELHVKIGGQRGKADLRRKRMADMDVTVDLRPSEKGDLDGTWSYKADAFTERDRHGGGRVGTFGLLPEPDLIGEQRGREVWSRAKPRVLAAVCVNDQTASHRNGAYYRYPLPGGETYRTLLVVGENLKGRNADLMDAVSNDPAHVAYAEAAREYKPMIDDFHRKDYQKGWELLSNGMAREEVEQLRKYDAILLRVQLKHGVRPGIQSFTLKASPATWTLIFGDNQALLDFVRHPHEDVWEPTPTVFHSEVTQIQLTAMVDVPVDEVEIAVGVAGGMISFGEKKTLTLKRIPKDPEDKSKLIHYRSDPLLIVDPDAADKPDPGQIAVPAAAGEELMTTLAEPGLFLLVQDPGKAVVRRGPGELGNIWKDYLRRAAKCKGIEITDWSTISGKTAGEISHTILFDAKISHIGKFEIGTDLNLQPKNETLRVTIADHAAMLLLREDFLDAMREAYGKVKDLSGIPLLNQFGSELKRAVGDGRNALSRLQVTSPGGHEIGVGAIWMLDWIQERFKLDSHQAHEWAWKALVQAHQRHAEAMAEAIRMAEDVGTCDLEGLVHLTGFGFDAVVHRVLPRLMKLETTGHPAKQRWVPDLPARAAVKNLSVLADAVRALEEYSETDTAVAMAVVSLVAMPFMAAESALAKAIALGVDLAGAGVTAGFEIPDYLAKRADVRFARGAGAVLGTGRLDEAEMREIPTWQAVLAVGGATLGVGFSSVDLGLTLRNIRQVRRAGEEAVTQLERGGLAALRQMDPDQQRLVLAYAADAGRVRHEAGAQALTEGQRKMLSLMDRMQEESKAAKPAAAAATPDVDVPRLESGAPTDLRRPQPHITDPEAPPIRDAESRGLTGSVADAGRTEPPRPVVNDPAAPPRPRADDPTAPPRPRADDPTAPPRPSVDDPPARPRIDEPSKPPATGPRPGTTEFPELPPTRTRPPAPSPEGSLPRRPAAPRDLDDPRPPVSPHAIPEKPPVRRDAVRRPRPEVEARVPEARRPWSKPAAERPPAPRPRMEPVAKEVSAAAEAAAKEVDRLKAAGAPKKAIDAARDRAAELKGRKELLEDFLKDADAGRPPKLTERDLEWLSPKPPSLTNAERDLAKNIVEKEFKGDWKKVLNALKDGDLPRAEMHKVLAYRKETIDKMLDDVIAEVKAQMAAELGHPVEIERKAFGSTNLTSDYDISVSGPGAERVIGRFNKRFRDTYKVESGTMFDTNIYTDPVYDLIKADSTLASKFNANPLLRDEMRQMMYEQMTMCKYSSPGQWERHGERLLDAVDEAERPALRRMLQEVESRQRAAEGEIADGLRKAGLPDTPDARLRINNDIYAQTLERIDQFRSLERGMSRIGEGRAADVALPGWLKGSAFERDLRKLDDLKAAGNNTAAKRLEADLKARVASQLRNYQGKALYHASEAYQGEGTIAHVVKELQAAGRKVDPDVLLRVKPTGPLPDGVRDIHYLGSFHENKANMMHALHDVLDDRGAVKAGVSADKQFKASMKASKYFVRELDGAHHGGINLLDALPKELQTVVRETVALDNARGTAEQFAETLKKLNLTPEKYLEKVMDASDRLTREAMKRSPFRKVSKDLTEHYKELDGTLKELAYTPKARRFERLPDEAEDLTKSAPPPGPRPPPDGPQPPLRPDPLDPISPGKPFIDPDGGRVDVGDLLGEGHYARVYKTKDGKVVKFIERGDGDLADDLSRQPRSRTLEGLHRTRGEVVEDLKANSDLLAKRGIPQLDVEKVQPKGNSPYVIAREKTDAQKTFKADQFRRGGREKLIQDKTWTPDHEQAVVELYWEMAQKRLFWEDGGIENIYFETVNGKLRAGVLDQDRIGDWDAPGKYAAAWRDQIGAWPGRSGVPSLKGNICHEFSGPEEFMAKMLERKGWIKFDPETKTFKPGNLDPEAVKKRFNIDGWIKTKENGHLPRPKGRVQAA